MRIPKPRVSTVRKMTLIAVMGSSVIALAFSSGFGTPSAWGIGSFSLLCPLGGLEALLADGTIIPRAFASLVVMTLLTLLVGRAWCGWGCPVHIIRTVAGCRTVKPEEASHTTSFFDSCRRDKRLWILGGVIIATVIVGFPVFCLICPIGLTFATLISIWHAIQYNQISWNLLVFPTILTIELIILKRWCISLCPIGGLLAFIGHFSRTFQPQVDSSKCLRDTEGIACNKCQESCPENINLHRDDRKAVLDNCTRCLECRSACPNHAIRIPLYPVASPKGDSTQRK